VFLREVLPCPPRTVATIAAPDHHPRRLELTTLAEGEGFGGIYGWFS
jgi:hypothetical protein